MENYMGVNRLCAELEGCGSLSRPYAEHEWVIDSKARMLYYRRQCRHLLFVGEVWNEFFCLLACSYEVVEWAFEVKGKFGSKQYNVFTSTLYCSACVVFSLHLVLPLTSLHFWDPVFVLHLCCHDGVMFLYLSVTYWNTVVILDIYTLNNLRFTGICVQLYFYSDFAGALCQPFYIISYRI